ncbi:MAG: terminase [Solobacterium sp.]|nr:terminase [Solobacterium sp.]
MSTERLLLSDKYKAFIRCNAPVEFLEGTTSAGKTTVGLFKFMLKVAESTKKLHILAAKDTGTAEKNIINKDLGIIDDFGSLAEYNGNGTKDEKIPHILFHTNNGDKVVYVMGYADKAKWKKALGGQYGCLYIDEINTADIEFVREAAMRCDYLMATLNPDDPSLTIYREYINCSRPIPEWADETPIEIRNELTEPEKAGWVHWFFAFKDNLALTPEKLQKIMTNTPRGTKIWKNKIEGLRGRATGLVFSNFSKDNIISFRDAEGYKYRYFSIGVDTAYSQKSPDTIAMIFQGITMDGRLITLDELVINNAELSMPVAPSDTVRQIIQFAEKNRIAWGLAKDIFIDSADQATISECQKYKRENGCIYNFVNAWKKTTIIDRINMQLGWIAKRQYLVVEHCRNHIAEMNSYSWLEDKVNEPEDGHDHTINANQYSWLPFRDKIGIETR